MADHNKTLSEWESIFYNIYKQVDENREPEQIWIGVTAHCSEIGEAIRKIHFPDLYKSAAHTICWFCSFIKKCNNTKFNIFKLNAKLSDVVLLKYPLKCGRCTHIPCDCPSKEMELMKDKSAKYSILYEEYKKVKNVDMTITQWIDNFEKIYGGRINLLTLEIIGFHFLEEIGECAIAIRELSQLKNVISQNINGINDDFFNKLTDIGSIVNSYAKIKELLDTLDKDKKQKFTSKKPDIIKARIVKAKMDMIVEIADAFSWFCDIFIKTSEIFDNCNCPKGITLENEIENEYFKNGEYVCPICEKTLCECVFFI